MELKSMYHIRLEHLQIIQLIEDGEGELTPEIEQALALTEEEFQDKAISYAYVVKKFEDNAAVIGDEIARLTELKQRAERQAKTFKNNLDIAMKQFGVEKIKGDLITISFRKSNPVELEEGWEDKVLAVCDATITFNQEKYNALVEQDVNILPAEALQDMIQYFNLKPSVSKTKIGDAIKEGITVPGAKKIEKKNLQIK